MLRFVVELFHVALLCRCCVLCLCLVSCRRCCFLCFLFDVASFRCCVCASGFVLYVCAVVFASLCAMLCS